MSSLDDEEQLLRSVALQNAHSILQARLQAEEEGRQQSEWLRVTLASIDDGVITSDIDGRVLFLNPVAEKLTGWSQAEARGLPLTTVYRLVHEVTREQVTDSGTRALQAGHRVMLGIPAMLLGRDGTETPIDGSAAPIHDEEGVLRGVVLSFRSLVDRRRIDSAIAQNEREMMDFFENASVALHWAGPDGILMRANQAELELFGYRAEEYIGHHISEFHVDQAQAEEIMQRLNAGDVLRGYEAQIRCQDGSIKLVQIDASVLWQNDEFVHTRCFTRDITDRRRAHEAHTRLAAIIESSDDAIVSKSLDGVIRTWNSGAERIFGYTAAQAIGRHITLIVPTDHVDEENRIVARIRAGESVEHFDTVRVRRDGSFVNVSLTISPIRDEAGTVIGASKIARDITSRKHAEESLRESERRFRRLADAAPVLIWLAGPDRCRTWFNAQWLAFVGRRNEDEAGDGWQQNVHPDDLERCLHLLSACLDAHRSFAMEYRLRRHDGEYRWVQENGMPMYGAIGDFVGYIGSCADITEFKEASTRKDRFLATLSHELRNPLAPIRNALQILKLKGETDPALQRWSQEVIERQVKQMTRLLEDLLDVSRISHQKLELRPERVDLAAVIHAAIETSRPLLDAGEHALQVALPPKPVFLRADPMRLAQVFANLLNNAAKYSDPGTAIRIGCTPREHDVLVSVRDEGIGIPAEMLPHIFEMFSQASEAAGHAQGGLGIGLSLARGLVEAHGGSIEARRNDPEPGSEFVVCLPLDQQADGSGRITSHEQPGAGTSKRRLVIVDDLKDNADSLARLLTVMGHEVKTAYTGAGALLVAAEFRPEVMLLDIGMPEMNGLEVCRQIRSQPWGPAIVLVAMTGWGQEHDRRRTEAAGFNYHLVKPVHPNALTELLAGPAV